MEAMRKLSLYIFSSKILSVGGFCLLFFICLNGYQLLSYKYDNIQKRWDYFYELPPKSLDILILGNSHAYSSYSPDIIDAICGTNSFVLASNSQLIEQTYFNLIEALKSQNPKIVIIQLSSLTGNSWKNREGDFRVYSNLDGMNYSLNKLNAILGQRDRKDYVNSMFSIFRNHDNWKNSELLASNLSRAEEVDKEDYRGFSVRKSEMGKKVAEQYELENKDDLSGFDISKSDENYLKKLHLLSENKDFKIVYVMSPKYSDLLNKTYQNKYETIKKVASRYGEEYLDFNVLSNEVGLKNRSFENGYIHNQHTSYYGAVQISSFLARHLENKYIQRKFLNQTSYWNTRMSKKKELYLYGSNTIVKPNPVIKLGTNLNLSKNIAAQNVFLIKEKDSVYRLILKFGPRVDVDSISDYKCYVHLFPKDSDKNISEKRKKYGFENFDFKLRTFPTEDGGFYVDRTIKTHIKAVEKLNLGLIKSKIDRSSQITITDFSLQ